MGKYGDLMKVYKFGDIPVGVETRGIYFNDNCINYLAEKAKPEFVIKATDKDLEFEQMQSEDNQTYPKSYLEFIALYRKFCEKAIDYGVILVHGSVLEIDGKAYMFSAPSGTGKSTHAKLWRDCFGDRVTMINDDKPLIKFREDGIYAYGTPWDGKHHLSTNIKAKLGGICFLHQAKENHIEKATKENAVKHLMNQVYRPRDIMAMSKTLEYVDKIVNEIPIYEMGCNISKEAAIVAYDAMKDGIL